MKKTLFFTLTVLSIVTYLGVPIGFAQSGDSDYTVRLIYFLPSGNTLRPNIDTTFDRILKATQKFYADEMERHGFGRKTFNFQTDRRGNAVVHHVNGRFRDTHYLASPEEAVWQEIEGKFNRTQNIYLIVIDTVGDTQVCGLGGAIDAAGGSVMMHIGCFNVPVTAHELGHAFGLLHDFRNDAYVMSYGAYRDELSPCHAEWLDVHRYFNRTRTNVNQHAEIEMFSVTASPPDGVRLRFTITDPDGLHQVQLHTIENHDDPTSALGGFLDCQSLNGQTRTVEFVTTELVTIRSRSDIDIPVWLYIIDVDGNFSTGILFDENHQPLTRLVQPPMIGIAHLPRGQGVSIPDVNLAAVIRETLELRPRDRITQLDMLQLISLEAEQHQITDLTGLEHAKNLRSLKLGENQIRDITPLSKLTQLKFLELWQNQIRDITPIVELPHLVELNLVNNQISDIRPLIELTQLKFLKFDNNPILDTMPLQTLRQNNPDLLSDTDLKIEGPWLWMIVPTDQKIDTKASALGKDYLAAASKGTVTEKQIATKGAAAGDKIGKKIWTLGKLSPTGGNNINEVVNAIGLAKGTIDNHVAYGSIILDSPRKQNTRMYAGSDDNHKVWLNGKLVHEQLERHWGHDYQESFPVTLKKGENVLLVAVEDRDGHWGGYFGFENGTVYSVIGETLPDTEEGIIEVEIDPDLTAAGPKIEGPWLWMIVPTAKKNASEIVTLGKDYLAAATKNSLTEQQIATNGASAGEYVKNRVWTLGRLAPTGGDNITEIVNTIGLKKGTDINHYVAYGSIALDSPRKQNTQMYAGSDDAVKVWLNGKLVHINPADRAAYDYQESFPVTLKKGKNILLVAVYNGWWDWSGFFGFSNDAVYSILTTPIAHIASAQRPPMYWIDAESDTLHRLVGAEVEDLVPGIQNAMSLTVDSTGSRIYWTEQTGKNRGNIKSANLDGSNVQLLTTLQSVPTSIALDTAKSKLYWTDSRGRIQRANLSGKQIRTFIKNLKAPDNITVDAARGKLYWTEASERIRRANTNGKSIENIASNLETINGIAIAGNKIYWTEITGESSGKIGRANLNGSNFSTLARLQHVPLGIAVDTAGSRLYWTESGGSIRRSNLNGKKIQNVISGLTSPVALVLESVRHGAAAPANSSFASVQIAIPDATRLLANYPNPFNPETWIPYQLTEPSDVKITIYDTRGVVVRHLDLGPQPAGTYTGRTRAAYWDGRNALGESVASGVYFYTLTAGEFTATGKMLIRK